MWQQFDDWLARTEFDSTLRVDNGGGIDAYFWSPPSRTTLDDNASPHSELRGRRPQVEPQGRTP